MKSRKATLVAVIAVLVFLAAPLAYPQGQRDESSPNVVIYNPPPYAATFYLKNGDGNFLPFSLPADDWAAYKNVTHVRIFTNRDGRKFYIDRQLRNGRYDIYRNEDGYWDVGRR